MTPDIHIATDIHVANHGSVVLLTPLSPAARDWFADHLPTDAMHFGAATVVEPRYVQDILDGAEADGLSITAGESSPT